MTETIAVAPHRSQAAAEEAVVHIARTVLGRPTLGLDDDLFDHGATSLSFVRVLAQINQELHVMVHAAALGGLATPRNLAACVTADPAGSALDNKGV